MLDDNLKTQLQSYLTRLTQPIEVFDAFGECFDVAEHHGRRTAATHLVPSPHYMEPIVGIHFAACDCIANSIHQNLGTAARNAA